MSNTINYKEITNLKKQVELLAPAGKMEVLEAVVEAGADAVYLSSKQLNMRNHKATFHFDSNGLQDAVEFLHVNNRRMYVTVNTLLGEDDLDKVRKLFLELEQVGIDAVIVQDLATIEILRELHVPYEIHASTMMNVHCTAQAKVLRDLGVSRIVMSRDITIDQAGRIGREAEIEIESFVHGDVCVSHSGQCSMSGVLFGKSGNRGECLKPCRWDYDLVRLDKNEVVSSVNSGHLLSIKDLCLIRDIPQLISAGICTFKIEGRMRDAEYLHPLVQSYRDAIDKFYENPNSYNVTSPIISTKYREKTRKVSSLTLLGGSSTSSMIDTSGTREPKRFSNGISEVRILDEEQHFESLVTNSINIQLLADSTELVVSVGSIEAALVAITSGADRVDLASELSELGEDSWTVRELKACIEFAHRNNVQVGIRTPRITDDHHWNETKWLLEQLSESKPDVILAHHLGTVHLAKEECPDAKIIADYGFNLLNSHAAALLSNLGVSRSVVSNEAGMNDLRDLAQSTSTPLEVFAHGSIEGMIIDHCVIALHASASGQKEGCKAPCKNVSFGLRDQFGEVREVVADQHCRNHLLTGCDVAILPSLQKFLHPNIAAMRIEAHFIQDIEHIQTLVSAYRNILSGEPWDEHIWEKICSTSPRPLNYGPYPRSIIQNNSFTLNLKKEQMSFVQVANPVAITIMQKVYKP